MWAATLLSSLSDNRKLLYVIASVTFCLGLYIWCPLIFQLKKKSMLYNCLMVTSFFLKKCKYLVCQQFIGLRLKLYKLYMVHLESYSFDKTELVTSLKYRYRIVLEILESYWLGTSTYHHFFSFQWKSNMKTEHALWYLLLLLSASSEFINVPLYSTRNSPFSKWALANTPRPSQIHMTDICSDWKQEFKLYFEI